MSRFGAVFGALLICAGAPGLVSAQGSAPPALVVVVPDSGDKVWLVDFAARQGPASLTPLRQNYQATFRNTASTSAGAPQIERYVSVTHHYDKSLLGRARFFLFSVGCDSRCAGDRTVTIQLPYYTFVKPDSMFQLNLGDLAPADCGASSISTSVAEQDHPQSYRVELLLGWWSAYQDCEAAGPGSAQSPAAIDALDQALESANWLVLHSPDRYAIDPQMQDEASTVLASSAFCTSAQINPSCVRLRRELLKSRVVDAAILSVIPNPSSVAGGRLPAGQLHVLLQLLSTAKGKLGSCSGTEQVQYNVCGELQGLVNMPDDLGLAWCAGVAGDQQAAALCGSLGLPRKAAAAPTFPP